MLLSQYIAITSALKYAVDTLRGRTVQVCSRDGDEPILKQAPDAYAISGRV